MPRSLLATLSRLVPGCTEGNRHGLHCTRITFQMITFRITNHFLELINLAMRHCTVHKPLNDPEGHRAKLISSAKVEQIKKNQEKMHVKYVKRNDSDFALKWSDCV